MAIPMVAAVTDLGLGAQLGEQVDDEERRKKAQEPTMPIDQVLSAVATLFPSKKNG